MDSEISGKRSWRQKIRDHYRLVILNDETLSEVSSYRLNLLNLYILLSTLLILVGLLVTAIIIYTPAKKLIPGYGDINANSQFIELTNKTDQLEKELNEIYVYLEGNKNRLFGNPQTVGSGSIDQAAYKPKPVDIGQSIKMHSQDGRQLSGSNRLEKILLIPPVTGLISAEYNTDSHVGVDIIATKNSAVLATADGFIISADYNLQTGNTISVQHQNNMVSFYKHNSSLLKNVGDYVRAGEAIAIVGNTGLLTSGPHLHFELWVEGEAVNPTEYIDF